jgi:SnoaL-like polyketide cyclase
MREIAKSLREFAVRYTAAWCSQDPVSVANHYSPSGSLSINGGPPAVGRPAIARAAQAFMTAFPDMRVIMDELIPRGEFTEYHWTLLGTNTGPGGSGKRVHISGYEMWKFSAGGLIEESKGHFDAAMYQHQLQHGVEA